MSISDAAVFIVDKAVQDAMRASAIEMRAISVMFRKSQQQSCDVLTWAGHVMSSKARDPGRESRPGASEATYYAQ